MRHSLSSPTRRVRRRLERGFTLMEAMITVGILSIIAGVLTSVYLNGVRAFAQTTSQMQLIRDGRSTMDFLLRELREAQATTLRIDRASNTEPKNSDLYFIDLSAPRPKLVRVFQEGTIVYQTIQQFDGGAAYTGANDVGATELEKNETGRWSPNPAYKKKLCEDVRMLKFMPRYDYFGMPGTAILSGGTVTLLNPTNAVDSAPQANFGHALAAAYNPAITGGQVSGQAWDFSTYPARIPNPVLVPGNPPAPRPQVTPLPMGTAFPGGTYTATGSTLQFVPGNYICKKLDFTGVTIQVLGPGAVNLWVVGNGEVVGSGPNRYLENENVRLDSCTVNNNGGGSPKGDPRWFNLYLTGAAGTNSPAVNACHLVDTTFFGSVFVPNVQEGVMSSVRLDNSKVRGQIMTRGGLEADASSSVTYDPRAGGWGALGTRPRDLQICLSLEKKALKDRTVYAAFMESVTLRNTAFMYYNAP